MYDWKIRSAVSRCRRVSSSGFHIYRPLGRNAIGNIRYSSLEYGSDIIHFLLILLPTIIVFATFTIWSVYIPSLFATDKKWY